MNGGDLCLYYVVQPAGGPWCTKSLGGKVVYADLACTNFDQQDVQAHTCSQGDLGNHEAALVASEDLPGAGDRNAWRIQDVDAARRLFDNPFHRVGAADTVGDVHRRDNMYQQDDSMDAMVLVLDDVHKKYQEMLVVVDDRNCVRQDEANAAQSDAVVVVPFEANNWHPDAHYAL